MARQTGPIKIQGTLDDLIFYKVDDKYFVRRKPTSRQYKKSPAFLHSRELNAEFGSAATSGMLLRHALKPLMLHTAEKRIYLSVSKAMLQIKDMDVSSKRGERSVCEGISRPEAKALLNGFDFNSKSLLRHVLLKDYTYDQTTGSLRISNLTPTKDVACPGGATHVTISGAVAQVDFAARATSRDLTNEVNLPINDTGSDIVLTSEGNLLPASGTRFFALKLAFYQLSDGTQQPLDKGTHNALAIVAVY